MVGPVANRDYLFDAPLHALSETRYSDIGEYISPIASTNFWAVVGGLSGGVVSEEQRAVLRELIDIAGQRGIGARFWGTPYWPIRVRDAVWRVLVDEGVALLNADDLDAVGGIF